MEQKARSVSNNIYSVAKWKMKKKSILFPDRNDDAMSILYEQQRHAVNLNVIKTGHC